MTKQTGIKPYYISWVRYVAFYEWWSYRGRGADPSLNWLGHAWLYRPARWLSRLGKSIPTIVLVLILWRVW